MKYEDNKVTDIRIAYIGGGSRGWAWSFMTDLSMEASISGTIRLYDIDEAAAKNNEIIGNHLNQRPDTMGKWNYVTCKTLEEALTGCDFVVISILPGTFDEMSSDVHLPERLNIPVRGGYRRPGRHDPRPAHHPHVCGNRRSHSGLRT